MTRREFCRRQIHHVHTEWGDQLDTVEHWVWVVQPRCICTTCNERARAWQLSEVMYRRIFEMLRRWKLTVLTRLETWSDMAISAFPTTITLFLLSQQQSPYFCFPNNNYRISVFSTTITSFLLSQGEEGSVAVLPPRCGPLSPGSIPGPGVVWPFGFQSKLASAGFSPGTPVFLLHLKLHFFSLFLSIRSEGPSGKQYLYTE